MRVLTSGYSAGIAFGVTVHTPTLAITKSNNE